MKRLAILCAGLLTMNFAGQKAAAQVPGVAEDCGTCHVMQPEGNDSLADRTERKGPPLYYAGNKFREPWLVEWLQDPYRIRPAGDFPPAHTRTEGDKDVVAESSLEQHPVLDEEKAAEVAEWLMTLTPYDELIEAEADYEPGSISRRLGELDFVKFKGCGACHKDTPEYGGVSGPELFTAWQRLQPAFIASYIRNPGAWEPYSLMPDKGLKTDQIHKLANYLRIIGEEEE